MRRGDRGIVGLVQLVSIALAVFLVARTPTAAAAGYESVAVSNGGTIVGVVRVAKPLPPPPPPLEVFKNKEVCGATVPNETQVIATDGALRYAVVALEGLARGRAAEPEAFTVIDNVDCRFVPHVASASVGQWLVFRNSDPILHNADGRLGRKTLFNVGLPRGRQVRRPLVEPGLVEITCDVRHTWMKAYVFVAEHPYHAVTDIEGVYEIRDVPPGRHTVRVWHERLGDQRKEANVEGGKVTILDFEMRH